MGEKGEKWTTAERGKRLEAVRGKGEIEVVHNRGGRVQERR